MLYLVLSVLLSGLVSWLVSTIVIRKAQKNALEMGSTHWEVGVLAKYVEELAGVEFNRNEKGYITGIVHTIELHAIGESEMN